GTATSGIDYVATAGSLQFDAGVTSRNFSVRIINDSLVENDETINLILVNPIGNAVLGQVVKASIVIVDDDSKVQPSKGIEVDKRVDFGNVVVGQTVTRSINIRNTGGVDVSFTSPVLISGANEGYFVASQPSGLRLGPGQSTSFDVSLKPTFQADSLSGAVAITSNGLSLVTNLTGSATERSIFTVLRPVEREVLTAGLPYFVRFDYRNREVPISFTIVYSVDGGATFPVQNQIGIIASRGTGIIWNVPDDLITDTGQIQVIARFPSGIFATALSGIFSVRKPGGPPNALSIGDFNGDGLPDLAITKAGAKKLQVLIGKGAGGFGAPMESLLGVDPRGLVNADFNKDGKPDIATANLDSGSVSILLGRGDGTFEAPKNISLGASAASIVAGDFDGDGNIDIATGNVSPSSISILFGDGKGGFGNLKSFALPSGSRSIAVGDFNGD